MEAPVGLEDFWEKHMWIKRFTCLLCLVNLAVADGKKF